MMPMQLTPEQSDAWIAALTKEGDAYLAWKRAAQELDAMRKSLTAEHVINESAR